MNKNHTENCAIFDIDNCAKCTIQCSDCPEISTLRVWRGVAPTVLTQKFIDEIDEFNSINFSKVKLKNLVFKNKRFFNCDFKDTEHNTENFRCSYRENDLLRVDSEFFHERGFRW